MDSTDPLDTTELIHEIEKRANDIFTDEMFDAQGATAENMREFLMVEAKNRFPDYDVREVEVFFDGRTGVVHANVKLFPKNLNVNVDFVVKTNDNL